MRAVRSISAGILPRPGSLLLVAALASPAFLPCACSPVDTDPIEAAEAVDPAGDGRALQRVLDSALPGDVISCDWPDPVVLSTPIVIRKPVTLKGFEARLPKKLGGTPLIVVEAEGVAILDAELHGNHDTVPQERRASLIRIHAGKFRVERCRFFESSMHGVEVCPQEAGEDIVGGVIRDIEAFRMGRDAVSLSGGNRGLRVRDVSIENVRMMTSYRRGAVEVSDGTDSITVRDVYAEASRYAVDLQDHGAGSAPNTNVLVENVEAVRCKFLFRTENHDLGHEHLTLRNLSGKACKAPVRITHTTDVTLEGLRILDHRSEGHAPITLRNCHGVRFDNVTSESAHFADEPVRSVECTDLRIEPISRSRAR